MQNDYKRQIATHITRKIPAGAWVEIRSEDTVELYADGTSVGVVGVLSDGIQHLIDEARETFSLVDHADDCTKPGVSIPAETPEDDSKREEPKHEDPSCSSDEQLRKYAPPTVGGKPESGGPDSKRPGSDETEELGVEDVEAAREQFEKRLGEWHRERERSDSSSIPPIVPRGLEVDGEDAYDTQTAKWELRAWRGHQDSWTVQVEYKLADQDDVSRLSSIITRTRARALKLLDYGRKVADSYDDTWTLTEVMIAAVMPDQYDHYTGNIARGRDRYDPESESYLDRWICN